ncbi:MAG: periplasmic protein TonB, partial [Mucilaginibacter sp.]|nr:periplasmic protein TonB [Mucilaginibacter sp.]
AYYLRQHYAGNLVRAMGITFLSVLLLFGGYGIFHSQPKIERMIPVVNDPNIHIAKIIEPKAVKPPAAKPLKAQPPVNTTKLVTMVAQPDDKITEQPAKITDITGAVGQTTSKGTEGDNTALPLEPSGGTGMQPAPDVSVHPMWGLDKMPEPVGGEGAWAKFLNKNLRFPGAAQDEGVSGKVFLSFIIEKDGSLSNIVVEKGAGHGFDEEALRVLKLAKAWKPGMQNGQAVRVRYTIPINFQLNE